MVSPTKNTPSLAPMLETLHGYLTALRKEGAELKALSEAQWNWSPDSATWSAVQVIEHLNKTGSPLISRFEQALEQLRTSGARGNGPFRYGVVERWFIRALSPDSPFKLPVPPQFVPAPAGAEPEKVLAEFLAVQEGLLRCAEAANGLDLVKVRVPSPVSRMFRPCLGAYLEASVAHERYHWLQVQALRANPGFPKA